MPTMTKAQQEALAQGVARGLSYEMAGVAAKYADGTVRGLEKTWSRKPKFITRVAEIRAEIEADGDDDLRPVIRELMAAARKAVALTSGVGMRAAADMYAEAARLKQALGQQAPAPEPVPELSREEWLALFAPPAPAEAA